MSKLALLEKENTIAPPGFNRWLIPPAALAVHLSIGQAYSLSVFNLPMSRLIGITTSAPDDWGLTTTVWIFNIAFVFLGLSAALFGKWVERSGPRKSMVVAALCWCAGFLLSAIGIRLHEIGLVYFGYGVLGGIGLGIGYISPVSTLMKWFPDRPGMATGMAIMGFGGGAMVGSPLAVALMDRFKSPESVGVWQTFVTMGLIYFGFMLFGAAIVRVPAAGWRPAGFVPPAQPRRMMTTENVTADQALRTPQFWQLWIVLCMNVTAGIGILSQASPMIQEAFPQRISPSAAAGFVGLLSLFNLLGRFFWSSFSDRLGRQMTYAIYLGGGVVLYALLPAFMRTGNLPLFVIACCIIISTYGGGFATAPAYLRDLFGTYQVGAIHGRLLTAWSTAAVLGPTLVTYIREFQIASGVPRAQAYSLTMYIMVALLLLGLLSNAMIHEVHARHHHRQVPGEDRQGHREAHA